MNFEVKDHRDVTKSLLLEVCPDASLVPRLLVMNSGFRALGELLGARGFLGPATLTKIWQTF